MAEMNQTQVKYARQRAEGIFADKRKALEAKHRVGGVSLDINQKLDAIRKGEITIKKPAEYQGAHQWSYQITFNAERPPVFDNDAYTKEEAALRAIFNSLMDELMLGDNQEALKLLKAFEVG